MRRLLSGKRIIKVNSRSKKQQHAAHRQHVSSVNQRSALHEHLLPVILCPTELKHRVQNWHIYLEYLGWHLKVSKQISRWQGSKYRRHGAAAPLGREGRKKKKKTTKTWKAKLISINFFFTLFIHFLDKKKADHKNV